MAYITKTSGPGAYSTGLFDLESTTSGTSFADKVSGLVNNTNLGKNTTPSGPSFGDKFLDWAKTVGTDTLTNIVRGQTGTAQQIAPVVQPTNYLPYIALGGVAIAAVLILKKKKG